MGHNFFICYSPLWDVENAHISLHLRPRLLFSFRSFSTHFVHICASKINNRGSTRRNTANVNYYKLGKIRISGCFLVHTRNCFPFFYAALCVFLCVALTSFALFALERRQRAPGKCVTPTARIWNEGEPSARRWWGGWREDIILKWKSCISRAAAVAARHMEDSTQRGERGGENGSGWKIDSRDFQFSNIYSRGPHSNASKVKYLSYFCHLNVAKNK